MSLLLVVYEMKNLVVVPDYRNLGAAGFTDSEVGDADERVTPITGRDMTGGMALEELGRVYVTRKCTKCSVAIGFVVGNCTESLRGDVTWPAYRRLTTLSTSGLRARAKIGYC
jgi:hypothetical protein